MKDVEQRNKKEETRFFSNEDIPCNLETHRQTKKQSVLLPTNFLSLFCFINTVLSDFNFGWIENLGKVFIILIFF